VTIALPSSRPPTWIGAQVERLSPEVAVGPSRTMVWARSVRSPKPRFKVACWPPTVPSTAVGHEASSSFSLPNLMVRVSLEVKGRLVPPTWPSS